MTPRRRAVALAGGAVLLGWLAAGAWALASTSATLLPWLICGPLGLGVAGAVLLRAERRAEAEAAQTKTRHLAAARERADDARLAAHGRLEALLSGLPDGLVLLDRGGRTSFLNPAARRLLDAHEDRVGGHLVDLVRNPALLDAVRGALAGTAGEAELERADARGAARVLAASVTPEPGGGCLIVLRDVTGMRHLERVRRDFVANVSHELRTPVSVVLSSAEALVDGALDDPEEAARFAEAIHRHAQRLGDLITDILSLSRIEAGLAVRPGQAVRVCEVVESVVADARMRAEAQGQALEVQVAPELSAWADPSALRQILDNLVDNAIRHTGLGTRVRIGARADDGGIVTDVADDGPGIPMPHRQRVFERFYRVDRGRSRDRGGTGLGLAIVRHLAEQMGGSVAALDNRPRGALLRVRLPAPPGAA